MKCSNCERFMGTFSRRCRVCHQRLPFWYVLVTLFVIAGLAGLILLLEIY